MVGTKKDIAFSTQPGSKTDQFEKSNQELQENIKKSLKKAKLLKLNFDKRQSNTEHDAADHKEMVSSDVALQELGQIQGREKAYRSSIGA